jgi:hypothetical protein
MLLLLLRKMRHALGSLPVAHTRSRAIAVRKTTTAEPPIRTVRARPAASHVIAMETT